MNDPAEKAAEMVHEALKRRLSRIYSKARNELLKKAHDFDAQFTALDARKRALLDAGKLTQEEYQDWLRYRVFQGKKWRKQADDMTRVLENSNRIALNMINGEQNEVFAAGANYTAYKAEQLIQGLDESISFTIYDEKTVARLLKEQPELLPRKVIDGVKDRAWNRKNISNTIAQGILQGASIPDIAEMLARNTSSTNLKAMVRYARTAMTGAQNAGRIETMHRAESMGIKVKKQWMCTLDSKTRDAHQRLDGQTVDVDKPFKSILGKIMYPGDPEAHPGNVYNCRCTMIEVFPEYPYEEPRETYEEWKKRKGGR
jgi:uncharacterized protein with gpF-like domain